MTAPGSHGSPGTLRCSTRRCIGSLEKRRGLPPLLAILLLTLLVQACRPVIQAAPAQSPAPTRSPTHTTSVPIPEAAGTDRPATASPDALAEAKAIPSATAPPASPTTLACLTAGGRIETHLLYTELSSLPWEFRVYVPPCYDQQPERRYPTLYLVHGSTYTDDQWDRLGADETADRLVSGGEIAPMLIVMPRDRRWVEPTEDPFGEAMADHILPWVEENYRALPGRENRAIGGLSRGAAWAVHLGLSRWELFSAIGAHSLPVFWSDTGKVRDWLADIPTDRLPRIYLDIGERDYLIESAIWFEGVLDEMDIPHEWHLFPGRHEEAYWEANLEGYLRWYAADW